MWPGCLQFRPHLPPHNVRPHWNIALTATAVTEPQSRAAGTGFCCRHFKCLPQETSTLFVGGCISATVPAHWRARSCLPPFIFFLLFSTVAQKHTALDHYKCCFSHASVGWNNAVGRNHPTIGANTWVGTSEQDLPCKQGGLLLMRA